MSGSPCRQCGRAYEMLDDVSPPSSVCPQCEPGAGGPAGASPRFVLQRKISGRAVAVTIGVVLVCGLCVLGFARWKYMIPCLLAAGAVPFVRRALTKEDGTGAPVSEQAPWHPAPDAVEPTSLPLPPRSASVSERGSLASRVGSALLVMAACAAIMFVRKPDVFRNPQFWAEDAYLFSDARKDGLASFLTPHSKGQTVLVQRLIAYVGRPIAPRDAPAFYIFAALAGMLAVAAYVSQARIDGLGPVPRALMAVTPALMYTSGEILVTLANLHWILAVLLLTILIERDPETRWGRGLLLVVFGVLCLTGPFIIFLLPLFLLRALLRRTPCSVALFTVGLPCALWQVFRIESSRTAGVIVWSDPRWQAFLGREYVGQLFFGGLADSPHISGGWFLGLLLLVYGALGWHALRRRDVPVGMLLLGSFLILAATAFMYRHDPGRMAQAGIRYYYLPYICVTWALLMAAARARMPFRVCAGVAVIGIVVASLSHFLIPPMQDLHWVESSRFIDGPEPCEIFINPYPHFWILYQPDPLPPKSEVRMLPDPLPPRH